MHWARARLAQAARHSRQALASAHDAPRISWPAPSSRAGIDLLGTVPARVCHDPGLPRGEALPRDPPSTPSPSNQDSRPWSLCSPALRASDRFPLSSPLDASPSSRADGAMPSMPMLTSAPFRGRSRANAAALAYCLTAPMAARGGCGPESGYMASMAARHESRSLASDAAAEAPGPVSSPLLSGLKGAGSDAETCAAKEAQSVRAKLSYIKQGVRKVNLVAALVRGMSVDDAMKQMAVSRKRAAKTVAKVIHAAKSNAVQNHGLDGSNLVIEEAFVGKDRFLKRMNPHGRGKAGRKERPRVNLTVVVREMTAKDERSRAPTGAAAWGTHQSAWRRRLKKLMPHRLVEVGAKTSPAPVAA